jgi:hypothetical protein
VVSFVLSRNPHRGHLSESQRAIVAARTTTVFEEKAAERRGRGPIPAYLARQYH